MKHQALRLLSLVMVAAIVVLSARAAGQDSSTPKKQVTSSETQLKQAATLLDSWRGQHSVLDEARNILDSVLRENPDSAKAYREYARYFLMKGYLSGNEGTPESEAAAERSLLKAIQLDPKFAEAYVLAGHLYFGMKRIPEAKAALTKAEALGTNDPWLHNNWADILLSEGRFDEAAKRYQKVVDSQTKNAKAKSAAFDGLIKYFSRTGRLDEVDNTYRKQIAFEPDTAWSYGNYAGFLLCAKDDYESAIVQAKKAISLMSYGLAYTTLASALYRKWAAQVTSGQLTSAQTSLLEAKTIRPGNPAEVVASFCGSGAAVKAVQVAVAKISPLK